MRTSKNIYFSLAAPLLVCLAIFGFFNRKDDDRVQPIPALATGIGMIFSSFLGRNLRRKTLLTKIQDIKNNLN